jgi:transcriptional regulator with XRE-family HTH domain
MAKKRGAGVVEELKQAIRRSGQSLYRLAQTSGVGKDRLGRFMRGERGLTVEAVEKVAEALGLQLRLVGAEDPPAKPKRPRKRPPADD